MAGTADFLAPEVPLILVKGVPHHYQQCTSHITLVPLVPSSSAISYQAKLRCTTKLLVPELVMYHTWMSTSQIGTCVHFTSLKRRTTQYESILIHIYNTGGQRLLWLEEDLWSRVRLVVPRSSPLHPSGWTDALRGKVFPLLLLKSIIMFCFYVQKIQ